MWHTFNEVLRRFLLLAQYDTYNATADSQYILILNKIISKPI